MSPHTTLGYGADAQLLLHIPPGKLVAHGGLPRQAPLQDVAAAVAEALTAPLDFPPLIQASVPDDRIAIAVGSDLPQASAIATGVVQALLTAGASPDRITLVCAAASEASSGLLRGLPADLQQRLRITRHDADDALGLAYLASSTIGHPIYINRVICDADLVISTGCLRLTGDAGTPLAACGIYPAFADRLTQERFQVPLSTLAKSQRKVLRREIDEAAWLLGARLTVQVVPGQGDRVLHAMAGDLSAVIRQGEAFCRQAWSGQANRRAQLVVAGLEGNAAQQTWDNLARTLLACLHVVDLENGAIAICTELTERPGPAVQRLLAADSAHDVASTILAQGAPDVHVADRLQEALQQVPVYLLSGLSEDLVSDLGLAFVASPQEIDNLCQRHASCIVLSNAQHCWLTIQEEMAPHEPLV